MADRLFISYAGRDRAWAEWVAWQLREAGHQTEIDCWDWAAGDNAILRMSDALQNADRVVALFSEAYFEQQRFTTDEWTAVLAGRGRLVPLKIEAVTPPAVLGPVVCVDLYGLDAQQARRVLLRAAGGGAGAPDQPPDYPGQRASAIGEPGGPRLPGEPPEVWNVPRRMPAFTGRDALLVRLRERFVDNGSALVQTLHGMGGVGKSTLATEYAHRFANGYRLAWWIDAEQAELIPDQLAQLASVAGWMPVGTDTPRAAAEALRQLRTSTAWLLVFDNAVSPADVHPWLPSGSGHVLITSRNPAWTQLAEPITVDVLARSESRVLLRRLAPALTELDADGLADALGDLPLALAQSGGVLAETGMAAKDYLHAMAAHAADVLAEGTPPGYPASLVAAVRLSMDKLAAEDEAAAQLLQHCAFLAAETVPAELFTTAPRELLPEPLATLTRSQWELRRTLGRIGRYGLAAIDTDGLRLHRLTQAILRDHLDAKQQADQLYRAESLVAASIVGEADDPACWPHWAALLPHLLALDPSTSTNPVLRRPALHAAWYLQARGDIAASRDLAARLHERWRRNLGPDHDDTLAASYILGVALQLLGDHEHARDHHQDTLERRQRVYGDDHHDTLHSADTLGTILLDLGSPDEARRLHADTLDRCQHVFGEDDTHTLTSANNLAVALAALGEHEQSSRLHRDTLARRRRVLGDDHPDTLTSINHLRDVNQASQAF